MEDLKKSTESLTKFQRALLEVNKMIKGKLKLSEEDCKPLNNGEEGYQWRYDEVDIDIEPINGQRSPESTTLKKWIKAEKGVNFVLLQPILAAEWYEDGVLVQRGFDGSHRQVLRMLGDPSATKQPAIIISVPNEADANRLFVKFNYSRRQVLKAEDIFVNGYLADDEEITKHGEMMVENGLQVAGTSVRKHIRVPFEVKNPLSAERELIDKSFTAQVKVVKFREKCGKVYGDLGHKAFDAALGLLERIPGWKRQKQMRQYLIFGVTDLFVTYPDLFLKTSKKTGKLYHPFKKWLEWSAQARSRKEFSSWVWNSPECPMVKGKIPESMAKALLLKWFDTDFCSKKNMEKVDRTILDQKLYPVVEEDSDDN